MPFLDDMTWLWTNNYKSEESVLQECHLRYCSPNCLHLLANLADGFLVVDTGLKILQVNRALTHMLGYSQEELVSNNLLNFCYDNKDQIALLTGITRRFSGERNGYELTLRNRSGNPVLTHVNPSPLYDESGKVVGSFGIIKDLSELKQAHIEALYQAQQLEKANQAKTNLMAQIIHDIRTPMVGIIGASDLLSQETLSSYQKELVSTIQQCSEVLLGLVNDILDLSRIKAGFSILIKREFYLSQLVEECLLMIQPRIDSSKIELHTSIDPCVPNFLFSDPLQLRRIMLNLLSNAAKFTSQGQISIEIRLIDRQSQTKPGEIWLEFSVKDTGIGIPENELAHIFEAFQQVNRYDKGGTGLGLSICRELVHLLGGEISVTSKLGHGSTFSFRIPVEIAVPAPIISSINKQPASDAGELNSKRILIVDDNDFNRYILSSMLKCKGYSVLVACNGHECLSLLDTQKVDLVLMDMQMPLLNGYDTIHQIRSDHRYLNLPIIAVSAFTTKEEQDKCFKAGCTDYLTKPFSSQTLYSYVDKYVLPEAEKVVSDSEVESLRKELLPELMTMMELDLARMEKARKTKDWDTIAHIAHDIKGSAGIFGYNHLSELAERLYLNATKANEVDSAQITALLAELEDSLKKIKASIHS